MTAAAKSEWFRNVLLVLLGLINLSAVGVLIPVANAVWDQGKAIERVPGMVSEKLAPLVAKQNAHAEWMAATSASRFTMSDYAKHQEVHQAFEREIQSKLHAIELQLATVISQLNDMKEKAKEDH